MSLLGFPGLLIQVPRSNRFELAGLLIRQPDSGSRRIREQRDYFVKENIQNPLEIQSRGRGQIDVVQYRLTFSVTLDLSFGPLPFPEQQPQKKNDDTYQENRHCERVKEGVGGVEYLHGYAARLTDQRRFTAGLLPHQWLP
jgi:hypothetical protein